MRNLVLGFIVGLLVSGTLAWAGISFDFSESVSTLAIGDDGESYSVSGEVDCEGEVGRYGVEYSSCDLNSVVLLKL